MSFNPNYPNQAPSPQKPPQRQNPAAGSYPNPSYSQYPAQPVQPQPSAPMTGSYGPYIPPAPAAPPDSGSEQKPGTPSQTFPTEARRKIDWNNLIGRTVFSMLAAFLAVYFSWLYAPNVRNSMTWWPTNTPTPVTPSPTAIATATITPLATNTPTAFPTSTPEPLSTYWIADGNELDPAVPDSPEGVIELHVGSSAEINPPLDSGQWTSSDQIVADLGKQLYDENWYATYSAGWIRWFMDRQLREGLYELYIMDTVFSSGGSLTFSVVLGEQQLTPLTGSTEVHYMTSQYDPVQATDTWRSLGIYYIPPSANEKLAVTTSWNERDEYTIVSMDRLLIVPRPAIDMPILNALPQGARKYIRDESTGNIVGKDYALRQRSEQAWDGSYQLIINPDEKVRFTLTGVEPWPIGNYRLYAWMPTSKGGITANYSLSVDRTNIQSDTGTDTVSVTAPSNLDPQWVEIGSWTTDRYYERPRKIGVTLEIDAGADGEYPIDAIAFIYTPFSD